MKPKSILFSILIIIFAATFLFLTGCGDDDDDDSGGGSSVCDDFCDKLAECDLGFDLGITSTDECMDYCDQTASSTVLSCIADADNCNEVGVCFGTSDDDDDVDDDDDSSVTAEVFCAKVEECEDADAYVVDGACEASADLMAGATLDCALEDTCADFIGCVEGTDDGWNLDPMTIMQGEVDLGGGPIPYYALGNLEFGGYNSLYGNAKFTPFESLIISYQYNDSNDECDILGGSAWISMDDEEYEKYKTISPNAKCLYTSDYFWGSELFGDELDEGSHKANIVFLDVNGQQSEVFSTNFTVEQYAGGTGSTVDQLTDATFFLEGINGPPKSGKALSNIYFSNFAGNVMLFNSSTVWCTYCRDEANHLMELYNLYYPPPPKAGTVNMGIVTLLTQDISGGNPVEADLINWADRPDPFIDLTFPIVIDPQGNEFSDDYMISGGVPFSMIVDPDGVVRYKVHGYGSGMVDDFADIIDAIILEFETK